MTTRGVAWGSLPFHVDFSTGRAVFTERAARNASQAPLYRSGVFVVRWYVRTLARGDINDRLGELIGSLGRFGIIEMSFLFGRVRGG